MRNKVSDLNNFLFAQLERLDDELLKGEELDAEISRAKAMTEIAGQIINGGALLLKAWMAADRNLEDGAPLPDILETDRRFSHDETQPGSCLIPYGKRKGANG